MASTTSGDGDEIVDHEACFDARELAGRTTDATQPENLGAEEQQQSFERSRDRSSSNNDPVKFCSGKDASEHRTGVTVVDPQEAKGTAIDVVAIHGLCGLSTKTWAIEDEPGHLWLHEVFSSETSDTARAILYGYDPDNGTKSCYTLHGVYEMAQELLLTLLDLRSVEVQRARRPIFWVAHDLGGLVLKASMILARDEEEKYGDIIRCTRVLAFFGYPHRPLNDDDLQEQLLRLLSLRSGLSLSGRHVKIASALTQTVNEINGAFVHTKMLTQTILVNVWSGITQLSQSIFTPFSASFGVDFEVSFSIDRPHLGITLAHSRTQHPLQGKPDSDWLGAQDQEAELYLQRVLAQTPPTYPILHTRDGFHESPELRKLMKPETWNHIVHLRCSSGAKLVTEECRRAIDDMKDTWQFQFYFAFDSDDVRFSSLEPWFASVFAHSTYSLIRTSTWTTREVQELGNGYSWTLGSLNRCWDRVRSRRSEQNAVYLLGCLDECDESQALWLISQIGEKVRMIDDPFRVVIVTTKDTESGQKITNALAQLPDKSVTTVDSSGIQMAQSHIDLGLQLPLFFQEDPRYAERPILTTVNELFCSCQEDEDLKLLLLALLKSSPDHMRTMQLLGRGTQIRHQVFATGLHTIPMDTLPWALKVFSWLLTLQRPLRVFEFVTLCQLSEGACDSGCSHQWLPRRDPRVHHEANKIFRQLGHLLRIKHDEVQFSHPGISSWLLSPHGKVALEGHWPHLQSETERHGQILDLCLKCLSHLTGDHNADALFAYATEHWVHHYRETDDSRHSMVLNDVFAHSNIMDNWIVAYRRLPTPFVKPVQLHVGTSTPLAIASHFALDYIVKTLLAKESFDIDTWKWAVLECVRKGNLSTLRLVYGQPPVTLNFNNPVLHEIVNEAAMYGHLEVFRDIVQRIPLPSHDELRWSSSETRPKINDVLSAAPHELSVEMKVSPGIHDAFESENATEPSTQHERQDRGDFVKEAALPKIRTDIPQYTETLGEGYFTKEDDRKSLSTRTSPPLSPLVRPSPFAWLSRVVCKAAEYGLHDVLDILLSLGASPNSEASSHPRSDSIGSCALAYAGRWAHLDAMRVLLVYGADLEMKSGRYSMTPLAMTAQGGSVEAVKLLLDKGANVEASDSIGWMAVHESSYWGLHAVTKKIIQNTPLSEYKKPPTDLLPDVVKEGKYQTAKTLLECGVDPNSANTDGTALWHAICQERIDICQLLLDDGQSWKADPDFTPEGLTPPLVQAVREENLDIVKLLVERGADIHKAEIRQGIKRTPLTTAVIERNIGILQYLLEKKADPVVVDEDEWTPIWTAANNGDSEMVRLLGKAGAGPTLNSPCGSNAFTPLHAASEYPDTVQVLLELGADPCSYVEGSGTPSWAAPFNPEVDNHIDTIRHLLYNPIQKPDLTHPSVEEELLSKARWAESTDPDVLDLLLEAGANVNMFDHAKVSLLMKAMSNTSNGKIVRSILNYGPSLDFRDANDDTVLTCIGHLTSDFLIKLLVRCGANLDVANSQGETPLLASIGANNLFVFNYFLTQDIVRSSISTPAHNGETPLHRAIKMDNTEMVDALIGNGADINYPADGILGTPIMTAIRLRRDSVTKTLVSENAQLTRQAGYFSFPINMASLVASSAIISLLLSESEGVMLPDQFDRKPVHLACYNSLEVLHELGLPDADFTAKDRVGRVPLHYAAQSGSVEIVEAVLERSKRVGIDINVKDSDGWTPLLWAARFCGTTFSSPSPRGRHQVIEYLLANGADATVCVQGIESNNENDSWAAADIAKYHQADPTVVEDLRNKAAQAAPVSKLVGSSTAVGEYSGRYCDCCLSIIYGIYTSCMNCDRNSTSGFDLCFKCSRLSHKLHWATHQMVQYGGNESELDASEGGSSAPEPVYEIDDDIADMSVLDTPIPLDEDDDDE